MSDDADAAVGLALGTLSVAVSAMKTASRGMPKSWAATYAKALKASSLPSRILALLAVRDSEREHGHSCCDHNME